MQKCEVCAGLDECPAEIKHMIERQLICKEQRSDEWKKARIVKLTASEIPAMLGESYFDTPDAVFFKKLAAITNDDSFLDSKAPANVAAMEWGTNHEEEALAYFMEQTGHKVLTTGLLQHPTIPYIAGSPDGITYCGALVEIKCPYSGRIPKVCRKVTPRYASQVQSLLSITGLERAYFIQFRPPGYALCGVADETQPVQYTCLETQRDGEWEESALPVLERFYNNLVRRRIACQACFL